jgi:16S rRNA (uracil1498-N3)-methyltransferase
MAVVKIRRFKVDDCTGPTLEVVGREARHALRVLRLGVGDAVALFDGRGGEVVGRIASASRTGFTVSVQEQAIPPRRDRAERPALVLAVATPKGSRADWLVEKCAELGVGTLWLLRAKRGPVTPGPGKVERWRRKAVEAAKQAGQRRVMGIEPPRTVAETLAAAAGGLVLYGDPACAKATLLEVLHRPRVNRSAHERIVIFIGPEGGFTEEECGTIEAAGGVAVSLGESILRVETAAIAAAAVWGMAPIKNDAPG